MELDSFEQELKSLYEANPSWIKSELTTDELDILYHRLGRQFDREAAASGVGVLTEDDFFETGEDVAVLRHKRYFPPILHAHRFFEIMYVLQGECTSHIEQEEIRLAQGDVCILSPGICHSVRVFDSSTIVLNILVRTSTFETTFFNVLSDRDVLSRFFSRALHNNQTGSYLIVQTGADDLVRTFLDFLHQEYLNHEDYKNRMMANILQGFFLILLRRHNRHILLPNCSSLAGENDVFSILNYIQLHYNDLTLEQLSARFNYSSRHMARLIKESSGMNFGELIRTTKLKRSAKLLENPEIPISEIIQTIGYADLSAFHRAFKQFFGCTPAEYRKGRLGSSRGIGNNDTAETT